MALLASIMIYTVSSLLGASLTATKGIIWQTLNTVYNSDNENLLSILIKHINLVQNDLAIHTMQRCSNESFLYVSIFPKIWEAVTPFISFDFLLKLLSSALSNLYCPFCLLSYDELALIFQSVTFCILSLSSTLFSLLMSCHFLLFCSCPGLRQSASFSAISLVFPLLFSGIGKQFSFWKSIYLEWKDGFLVLVTGRTLFLLSNPYPQTNPIVSAFYWLQLWGWTHGLHQKLWPF